MNTITIELCAEDRARLDSLLAKLDRCIGEFIPSGEAHTDYGYKAQGVEYATQDEAAEAKLEEIPEPYSEPCPIEATAPTCQRQARRPRSATSTTPTPSKSPASRRTSWRRLWAN